jgi:mono/diheme cytochrome c family protein
MSISPLSSRHTGSIAAPSQRGGDRSLSRWMPLLTVALVVAAFPFFLAEAPAEAGPSDETLIAGAEVYTAVCASCHQAGGIGIAGQFPPLRDNPNIADAAYVERVIRNGLDGPITVNGETYDSVMPAQPSLSDADIVNVIAYMQSGFAAPSGPAPTVDTGPVAGTQLPLLANYTIVVAFLIAAGAIALVLGPRVIAAGDRREMTWFDAGLKSSVIVIGMVLGTTIIPSRVLEIGTVQQLPQTAQDVIVVGIWTGALVAGLWALWYAHRERRI